jgi:hypothetical protein
MSADANRTVVTNSSTYVLAMQSGEPGILLCDAALNLSSIMAPGAGQFTTLPANTRHPHSGKDKLFIKSVSGTPTANIFAS